MSTSHAAKHGDTATLRCHPNWRESHRTLDDIEAKVSIWQLIAKAKLQPRELKVLLLSFGFLGGAVGFRDVGAEIERSGTRAQQIEWKALRKLRGAAGLKQPDPDHSYGYAHLASPPPPPPQPRPQWFPQPEPKVNETFGGTIQLTCDDCGVRFKILTTYDRGQRSLRAAQLRQMGCDKGWTRIVGRDRCPQCSYVGLHPTRRGACQLPAQ